LEITQSYCYLGIIFSACGTFNAARQNILSKSLKAFYRLRQLDTRDNVNLTLKLFDTLILPICMYGSEVWGPEIFMKLNDNNFMQICDTAIIEALNIKLCKYVLGVSKRATNAAVKGELGRYPLLITILTQSYKFWARTCLLPIEFHVKKSYVESMMTNLDHNKKTWSNCMYIIMSNFNHPMIWESQGDIDTPINSKFFTESLESKYTSQWKSHIAKAEDPLIPNKLRSYADFKSDFKIENYILSCPLENRRLFSKLRISSHNLSIETGRYTKPKTPREKRNCIFCKQVAVEDEFHMLMNCSLYSEERANFIQSLESFSNINFDCTPEIYKLLITCNHGDSEFSSELCQFVNKCFQIRDAALLEVSST